MGAGPLVPRRGPGGRAHWFPSSYSHRQVAAVVVTDAGSSDVISLIVTSLTNLI
jgi:hypothetical protein